jgi:flavodoxin
MKTIVIYYSLFGNTRQVADAMAEALSANSSVKAVSIQEISADDLDGLDLVIMGCPTHVATIPKEMRPLLEALPRRCFKGTYAAVFDTSNKMSPLLKPFTAAKRLRGKMRSLGGRLLAKPETFHVIGREGPMYDGEIVRADEWAAGILAAAGRKKN